MPSATSPITALATALSNAPTLSGWSPAGTPVRVLAGSRHMSRSNSAPPRIVIFPSEGEVAPARVFADELRDVDRVVIAHLWGRDFDQLHELQMRFVQALDYQASPNPSSPSNPAGIYWKTGREQWDTTPDSSKQGEELYMELTAIIALDRVAPTLGLVSTETITTLSTTLASALGATDTTATLASTRGFPPTGIVAIDSEQILYTGITATTLTGLTRGTNGTTPATHSNGATVIPVQHT